VNLAEKILAAHCERNEVSPGEFINARVDVVLSNDITAPIRIREFRRLGVKNVFDPSRSSWCRTISYRIKISPPPSRPR
jgi:3-isopropylmalate/(R)-2-methylmalate dehydratase large subunit